MRTGDREVTARRTRGEISWVSAFVFWHSRSQDANCSVWFTAVILECFRALRLREQIQQYKNLKETHKWVNKRGVTIIKVTVLLLTVYPSCWALINGFTACSRLLSDWWLIRPSGGGGLETEWIILVSQGFLPLCCPAEAIWARGEPINHRRAASLILCGHLITHQHPNLIRVTFVSMWDKCQHLSSC